MTLESENNMMTYKQFVQEKYKQAVEEKISKQEVADFEKFADRLLAKFDIDVRITNHFMQRLNDMRNDPEIQVTELQRLFKKIAKKKAKDLTAESDISVVLKDIQSDLNLAVQVEYKDGEFDVALKTIMRKKNFTTGTQKVIKYK
jgi:hypothetical protein